MPVQVLSVEEREAWSRFPQRIEEDALGAFFTLTERESEAIRRLYGDQNRLAVALQVCALRWLGFIPDDLWSAPGRAVSYLAEQLDVPVELLTDYRALRRTRSEPGCTGGCFRPRSSMTPRLPCCARHGGGCVRSRSCGRG